MAFHNRLYESQHISVTGYANVGLQLFLPLGEIESINLIQEKRCACRRRTSAKRADAARAAISYAFVRFVLPELVDVAVTTMQSFEFNGHILRVVR